MHIYIYINHTKPICTKTKSFNPLGATCNGGNSVDSVVVLLVMMSVLVMLSMSVYICMHAKCYIGHSVRMYTLGIT